MSQIPDYVPPEQFVPGVNYLTQKRRAYHAQRALEQSIAVKQVKPRERFQKLYDLMKDGREYTTRELADLMGEVYNEHISVEGIYQLLHKRDYYPDGKQVVSHIVLIPGAKPGKQKKQYLYSIRDKKQK